MITGLTLNRMEVSLKVSHGEESLRSQDFAWQHDKSLASGTRGGNEYQGCEIKHSRFGTTFVEWESGFAVLGIAWNITSYPEIQTDVSPTQSSGQAWHSVCEIEVWGNVETSPETDQRAACQEWKCVNDSPTKVIRILRTPSKVRSTSRKLAGQPEAETRKILSEPSTSTRGPRSWNSETAVCRHGHYILEALIWWFPLSYGTFREWYIIHPPFQSFSGVCINAIGAVTIAIQYGNPLQFVAQHRPQPLRPIILGGLVICVTSVFISSLVTKVWYLTLLQGVVSWITDECFQWAFGNALLPTLASFGGSGLGGVGFRFSSNPPSVSIPRVTARVSRSCCWLTHVEGQLDSDDTAMLGSYTPILILSALLSSALEKLLHIWVIHRSVVSPRVTNLDLGMGGLGWTCATHLYATPSTETRKRMGKWCWSLWTAGLGGATGSVVSAVSALSAVMLATDRE
ncbi:hypothetical protein EDB83DRAFT_2315781 [Lactarius deliciosus]|nr:hypothetical protein EDB83DRAFT_2315781 [Lactarius deliciosus]